MHLLYKVFLFLLPVSICFNQKIHGSNNTKWQIIVESKIDSIIHNNIDFRSNNDTHHINYQYDYDFNAYVTNYIAWSFIFSYKNISLNTKISHLLHLGQFATDLYEEKSYINYSPLLFELFFLKYRYQRLSHLLEISIGRLLPRFNMLGLLLNDIYKDDSNIDAIMLKWVHTQYGSITLVPIQILSLSSLLSTPKEYDINYQRINAINNLKFTFSFVSSVTYQTPNIVSNTKEDKVYIIFKSSYVLIHSSAISGQDILKSNISNPLKGDKDWLWNNQMSLYTVFQQGWLFYFNLQYSHGYDYIFNNIATKKKYYILIQGINTSLNIQTSPWYIQDNYNIMLQLIGTYNSGNVYDQKLNIQRYGFIHIDPSKIGGLIFQKIRGSLSGTSLIQGGILDTPHAYTRISSSASIAIFLHQKIYQKFELLISFWGIWDTNKQFQQELNKKTHPNKEIYKRFGKYIGTEINLQGIINIYQQWNISFEGGIFLPGALYQIIHINPNNPFGTSPSWAIKISSQVHFDYQTN